MAEYCRRCDAVMVPSHMEGQPAADLTEIIVGLFPIQFPETRADDVQACAFAQLDGGVIERPKAFGKRQVIDAAFEVSLPG